MKAIVLCAVFVSEFALASGCPDLTGRFVSDNGQTYRISQTGCSQIHLSSQDQAAGPTTEFDFIVDGWLRPMGEVYFGLRWEGKTLVREVYVPFQGKLLLTDQVNWTLKMDASSTILLQQEVDPVPGTIYRETNFRKSL